MITEAIYLELIAYRAELFAWCVARANVSGDKLRALGALRQKIYNDKKPINYSCRGCVDSFMRDLYNLLKAYENTISKQP